mmetsp:Transcript_112522/g.325109  ORF Transcript_112522/g.325109 Transcript_112522/m.325109 type:complete len:435 (-) Transcript_112522:218-1522(-)|eukprot:CAMPEP_0176060180 /NCGR_PEP_ID=MMETSP0120_2-20121206/29993_1 /TAXON_ID=160619 /ORGANISM="Kryptoperidinium foliaceum, Strain CCMP 1326" /LENGTH=434 /DNA_ID=CAMNT_0017393719 /DNA_START=83 /DNA_END=1387 /DNA_ORIENTATION=-
MAVEQPPCCHSADLEAFEEDHDFLYVGGPCVSKINSSTGGRDGRRRWLVLGGVLFGVVVACTLWSRRHDRSAAGRSGRQRMESALYAVGDGHAFARSSSGKEEPSLANASVFHTRADANALPEAPVKPTCSSLVCPTGYARRPWSKSRVCKHSEGGLCSTADLPACCWPIDELCRDGSTLDFGVSSVLHNNLDGAGPGRGEPGLTLYDVTSHDELRDSPNRTVTNLEMFAVGTYAPDPQFVQQNGLDKQRRFVRVSVRPGTSLDLIGRFIEHPTWRLATLRPYYLSVLQLEGEGLGIGGFESYFLSPDTEVKVTVGPDSLVWFTAPPRTDSDTLSDPMDPLLLAEAQRRRSVTLRMPAGSHFSLSLRVAADTRPEDGRLLLAGSSSLTCPPPLKVMSNVIYKDAEVMAIGGNSSSQGISDYEAGAHIVEVAHVS